MDQWLLYEHEDGRHAAAPSANWGNLGFRANRSAWVFGLTLVN